MGERAGHTVRGAAIGRTLVRRPLAEGCVVAVALWLLVRLDPRHFGDRWIGDVDVKYYGWLAGRLGQLDAPTWRLSGVIHPAGLELPLLDGLGPISLSGLLARIVGRYAAVNLVIVGGLVANYLAARRLARLAIGAESGDGERRLVPALSGLAFMAAPLFASPASSFPPLLWAFPVPLLIAEMLPGAPDMRRGRLGGLLVVAYLCSVYHLVFGAIAAVALGLADRRSPLRRRGGARRALVGVGIAVAALSPFVAARLAYNADEGQAVADTRLADAEVFSADLADPLVLPAVAGSGASVRLGLPERPLERFRSAAVGWALLAGMVLVARRQQWRRVVGVPAVALLVLSWGPRLVMWARTPIEHSWLPYRALMAVPGLAALRAPYRVTSALAAVLVLALAVGLRGRRPRWFVAVAGLIVVSWWPSIPSSSVDVPPSLRTAFVSIADEPGPGAVAVAPFTCAFDDLDALNWQFVHRRAVVGCGVSTSATRWTTRAAAWFESPGLAALRCDPSVDVLGRASRFPASLRLDEGGIDDLRQRLGVRWIVFDRARAGGCATADATAAILATRAIVSSDPRFVLYDLGPLA